MDSLLSGFGLLSIGNAGATTRKYKSDKSTFSYPEYNHLISEQLPLMSWAKISNRNSPTRDYDTNIMGSFECTNNNCRRKGWSSKRVAITIRMYTGNRYNAIVYNQRCKGCKMLGSMAIDTDCYVERVVYRLKKWLGHHVETPSFSGNSKGPHQESLCEGCKAGHCTQGAA